MNRFPLTWIWRSIARLMNPKHIERFLATSRRHLMSAPRPHPRQIRLLVQEFQDAVAAGPQAELSAPQGDERERVTLAQAFEAMTEAKPALIDDLLTEIALGSNADVILFLAHAYAAWVLDSFSKEAFA